MNGNSFKLISEDKEFASRSKDVFGGLDKVQTSLSMNKIDIKPVPRKMKVQKKSSCSHKSLTHTKWKKYDLSDADVSSSSQNSSAAFSFLRSLKEQKKGLDSEITSTSNPFEKLHAFGMPEFVVGKEFKPKVKKQCISSINIQPDSELELDHLHGNMYEAEFNEDILISYEQGKKKVSLPTEQEPSSTLKKFKSRSKVVGGNVRKRKVSE